MDLGGEPQIGKDADEEEILLLLRDAVDKVVSETQENDIMKKCASSNASVANGTRLNREHSSKPAVVTSQFNYQEAICIKCNQAGTMAHFRRAREKPRKGYQIRWIWKHKCSLCQKFFGGEYELDAELNEYRKMTTATSDCNLLIPEAASNDEIVHSCTDPSTSESHSASPTDASMISLNRNECTELPIDSQPNPAIRVLTTKDRRKQTMRKRSGRRSSPLTKIHNDVEVEVKELSLTDDGSGVKEETSVERNFAYEHYELNGGDHIKKRPGRPKKRQAEPETSAHHPSPAKIPAVLLPKPVIKTEHSEEEIIAAKSKLIIDAVMNGLKLNSDCSDKPSTSEVSNGLPAKLSSMRYKRIIELLKYMLNQQKNKNLKLSSTLKELQTMFSAHASTTRVQGNNIIAMVESLANEFKFFRNECISEAKSTNEMYKKQQAEFEVKYGYRVMEREIVQSHLDCLQAKFDKAKLQMREMADDLARQDNEIREVNALKIVAEGKKYSKCQSCEANEELLSKLKPELAKARQEKADLEKKIKEMERHTAAEKERVKVMEAELKKQSFLARSYEAMDKQNRAKAAAEKEAAKNKAAVVASKAAAAVVNAKFSSAGKTPTQSKSSTPQPTEKSDRTPKPDEKELRIPSLSDIVDPDILIEAAQIGSKAPHLFKIPNKSAASAAGSVGNTPESPRDHYFNNNRSSPHSHQRASHCHQPHLQQHQHHKPSYLKPPPIAPKFFGTPNVQPPVKKPGFLCHQRDAHLPQRQNQPGPSKLFAHPPPWHRKPEQNRAPQQEGRMDWAAYMNQKKNLP